MLEIDKFVFEAPVRRAQLPEPIETCRACGGEKIRVTATGGRRVCSTCKGEGIVVARWYDANSPNSREPKEEG